MTWPSLTTLDVHSRPDHCRACPYGNIGTGFIPTWAPDNPIAAFLAEAGGEDEIITKQPLTGGTGRFFFYICEKLGLPRAKVLLANVLSCHPPSNNYPTGKMRAEAERHCRHYDHLQNMAQVPGGIAAYPADVAIMSVHPALVIRSPNLQPVFEKTMEKVVRFIGRGYHPLVILGDKAKEIVYPELYEGITKWVGHYEMLKPGELAQRLMVVEAGPREKPGSEARRGKDREL